MVPTTSPFALHSLKRRPWRAAHEEAPNLGEVEPGPCRWLQSRLAR
uniref:Uncharacterized protein n=1 Tax=Arundo donax TaxID=35708 RepID=A0A0A8ZC44_ARUDO